jgi:hypothetical protein
LLEISDANKQQPLYEINVEQVQAYQAKKPNAIFDDLMDSCGDELSKVFLKAQKKKKKKKKAPKSLELQSPSRERLEGKSRIISSEDLRINYSLSIYKRKNLYTLASRVSRWEKATVKEIRSFKDQGGMVQHYASLTDEEICLQRLYHLLTGIELILSDPKDKNIYSFPTNTGRGLIACLTFEGVKTHGCIYLGINKKDQEKEEVYHKYFEKSSFQDRNLILYDRLPKVQESEDEGVWEPTVPYEFSVSESGVILINYPKDKCSVEIMPIRKKFLDPHLFS